MGAAWEKLVDQLLDNHPFSNDITSALTIGGGCVPALGTMKEIFCHASE